MMKFLSSLILPQISLTLLSFWLGTFYQQEVSFLKGIRSMENETNTNNAIAEPWQGNIYQISKMDLATLQSEQKYLVDYEN